MNPKQRNSEHFTPTYGPDDQSPRSVRHHDEATQSFRDVILPSVEEHSPIVKRVPNDIFINEQYRQIPHEQDTTVRMAADHAIAYRGPVSHVLDHGLFSETHKASQWYDQRILPMADHGQKPAEFVPAYDSDTRILVRRNPSHVFETHLQDEDSRIIQLHRARPDLSRTGDRQEEGPPLHASPFEGNSIHHGRGPSFLPTIALKEPSAKSHLVRMSSRSLDSQSQYVQASQHGHRVRTAPSSVLPDEIRFAPPRYETDHTKPLPRGTGFVTSRLIQQGTDVTDQTRPRLLRLSSRSKSPADLRRSDRISHRTTQSFDPSQLAVNGSHHLEDWVEHTAESLQTVPRARRVIER